MSDEGATGWAVVILRELGSEVCLAIDCSIVLTLTRLGPFYAEPDGISSFGIVSQLPCIPYRSSRPFEEDAATLISLLKKRPLSITKDGPAVGLSFDATIDLAVGRVLRDASTLAFDFP